MKTFNQSVVNKLLHAEKQGATFYLSLEHENSVDYGYGFGGDYTIAEWVGVCKDTLKPIEYEQNAKNIIEVVMVQALSPLSKENLKNIENYLGEILHTSFVATQEQLNSLTVWS